MNSRAARAFAIFTTIAAILPACQPAAGPPAPAAPAPAGWIELASGPAGSWQPTAPDTPVETRQGSLVLGPLDGLAGLRWSGSPPAGSFEIELEARRLAGEDFFCGLTVPTRSPAECVTLIIGGWGGRLVGISSIDHADAAENETGTAREFENERWYRIRLAFEREWLQAWIDDDLVVDIGTAGRSLSLRPGQVEDCAPLGLATWMTRGEFRNIRWRPLPAKSTPARQNASPADAAD
jgi:hypothetical protein